ncbi:MAG: hypothetical protein ABI599_11405 [Flavobacteriales bacterium]
MESIAVGILDVRIIDDHCAGLSVGATAADRLVGGDCIKIVHPSPAIDMIEVAWGGARVQHCRILNGAGAIVQEDRVAGSSIPLDRIPTGL